MKYINNFDFNIAMQDILSEAFNIEAGKVYYKNGKLSPDSKQKYPSFVINDIKTTLKSNIGCIFVPNEYINNFSMKFKTGIISMSEKFKKQLHFDHLQVYSSLETGTDHFTVLKVKNNIETTSTSKTKSDDIIKRKICINEFEKIEKLSLDAKFTWLIYDHNQFIDDLNNYSYRRIPIICQLVSIFYDPEHILNLTNNQIYVNNLSFKNFRIFKNLLNICTYGEITPDFIDKYKYSNKLDLSNIIEIWKKNIKKPEFLPGWNSFGLSIILCQHRRAGFEIIRHLGNKYIYNTKYIPLCNIEHVIYQVDYSDVIIDHSIIAKANNICSHCDTPLYDDIYMIFEDKTSNIGKAYCAICLHSTFDPESHIVKRDGEPLYKKSDIIARLKYPTKLSEIIDHMEIDDILKNILLSSYNKIYLDYDEYLNNAMYLNFSSNQKYIGWSDGINNFLLYAYNKPLNNIFSSVNEKLNYIESSYIFNYIHVIC